MPKRTIRKIAVLQDESVYPQCASTLLRQLIKFFPATNIREVTEQIVEMGSEFIVNRQSRFYQFLSTTLKVFKSFCNAMDIYTQTRNGYGRE